MIGMIAGRGRGAAVATLVTLALSTGVWLGSRARPEVAAAPLAPDQAGVARMAAAQVWLPAMGASRAGCTGNLVIQALSPKAQTAVLVTWGESGLCPPSAAGPLRVECSGLLFPGSSWIMQGSQLAAGSRSGTLYSFRDLPAVDMCESLFYWLKGDAAEYRRFQQAFLSAGRYRNIDFDRVAGDALAVQWTERCGESLSSHAALRWGEASAWSDPLQEQLSYLPLIGADWEIVIQNMGLDCADAQVWLGSGDGRSTSCDALQIAPGEARTLRVADCAPGALSASVRASQAVAVVARRSADGPRAAYGGRGVGGPDLHLPLPGRSSGTIVVGLQNPSPADAATVQLSVDDRMGRRRLLREVSMGPLADLRLSLSAAEIGAGKDLALDLQVSSLADAAGRRTPILGALWQERDGLVVAAQELLVGDPEGRGSGLLALPDLYRASIDATGASTLLIIHNDVSHPGFTDYAMLLYDQNGLLDFVCNKLTQRESEFIDLDTWGYTTRGFHGSAVISAQYWEHDREVAGGQAASNPVGLSASLQRGAGAGGGGDPDFVAGLALAAGSYQLWPGGFVPRCPSVPVVWPTPRPGLSHRLWLPLMQRRR